MSTIIVYISKHGCTEKAADILRENIKDDVILINLKRDQDPDIAPFDSVIIGGYINVGKIQKKIKKFCEKNRSKLLQKKLGLFLCCMEKGENAESQFIDAFPGYLRDHASEKGLFGGEFNFEKMNYFERKIIKKIANINESVSNVDRKAILAFAKKF